MSKVLDESGFNEDQLDRLLDSPNEEPMVMDSPSLTLSESVVTWSAEDLEKIDSVANYHAAMLEYVNCVKTHGVSIRKRPPKPKCSLPIYEKEGKAVKKRILD